MDLFGDFLPFIGFRVVTREQAIERGMDVDLLPHSPVGRWRFLEMSWLGRGFVFAAAPVMD